MSVIPPMPEVSFVSQSRGALSCAPHLWRGLAGLWLPWAGVQGSRLFDWSGYANHGSFSGTGSPSWGVTENGSAVLVERDGSHTEYVEVSDETPWSAEPPFTIASWCKPRFEYDDGPNYLVFQSGNARIYSAGGDYYRFYLYFSGDDLSLRGWNNPDREDVHDQWNLLVMRAFSDGTADAWQNLYYVGDDTWTGSRDSVGSMHFGCNRAASASVNWDGWLGLQASWNRAITDAEIGQLYADPHCMTRLDRSRLGAVRAAPASIIPRIMRHRRLLGVS